MFRLEKEQKVFNLAGIKIGGQPGENPPLMIASMFHNKDRILGDRKGKFDREKAGFTHSAPRPTRPTGTAASSSPQGKRQRS